MTQRRKLLTFIADFLLDEREAYPLRGASLRQAVLENPRVELERYGLSDEHVDLLLEHGPSPGVLVAAVRDEIVVALNQEGPPPIGGAAPALWPGDEGLAVECLEMDGDVVKELQIPAVKINETVNMDIIGQGFTAQTRFFFSQPGGPVVKPLSQPEPKGLAAEIEACKDGRQRISLSLTFPAGGTYLLRVREREGSPALGLNDMISVTLE